MADTPDSKTTPDADIPTAEKIAAQAEAGGRTMARPAGATGTASGLNPGGTLPTGSATGIGSIGTPGATADSAQTPTGTNPDGTSGMSGAPTNDSQPGGGTP